MERVSSHVRPPSKRVIIQGIAEDNGLYVPSSFPALGANPFARIEKISYAARAVRILQPFFSDFSEAELDSACRVAYASNFDSPSIAPVKSIGENISVLELWHGPTLAFKDMALQFMPQLLTTALRSECQEDKIVILVATSGDTGKAALEGFADVEGLSIYVFYPHEGVSEIQRLQMVTQKGRNVGVCGVCGNFDDAQAGVKRIFSDPEINLRLAKSGYRLSSANSINWGRLAPQVVYYYTGYEAMLVEGRIERGQKINVCVPTGNFGNILAAYYAMRCGLPVSKFLCASNINKVLTDFIRTGIYDRRREFHRTESPSMDILISSNLERLLFELAGRQPGKVRKWMEDLAAEGWYAIDEEALSELQSIFYGGFADRLETLRAIEGVYKREGYLFDPHSAVGYSVLQKYREETGESTPTLLVSTASPFKFSRAVLEALGRETSGKDEFSLLEELSSFTGQPVPPRLLELKSLPERHTRICQKEEMAERVYEFLGLG